MSKMWQPQPCGCGCPFGSKNLDHLDNDLLILPHGVGKASVHMSEAKCSDLVILFLLDFWTFRIFFNLCSIFVQS